MRHSANARDFLSSLKLACRPEFQRAASGVHARERRRWETKRRGTKVFPALGFGGLARGCYRAAVALDLRRRSNPAPRSNPASAEDGSGTADQESVLPVRVNEPMAEGLARAPPLFA